jgi:hypothetical protein
VAIRAGGLHCSLEDILESRTDAGPSTFAIACSKNTAMEDAAARRVERQAKDDALAVWSITEIGPLAKKARKRVARYGRIA